MLKLSGNERNYTGVTKTIKKGTETKFTGAVVKKLSSM